MTPACHPGTIALPGHCETGRVEWAAVVLSGGGATRLDGADKAALEHDGRTLLDHALDAVAAAGEVVVVGPECRPPAR